MNPRRRHQVSATSGCARLVAAEPGRGRRHATRRGSAPDSRAGGLVGIPGVLLGGMLVFLVVFHASWLPKGTAGARLGVAQVRADVMLRETDDGAVLAMHHFTKAPAKKPQARAPRRAAARANVPKLSPRPVAYNQIPKPSLRPAPIGQAPAASAPATPPVAGPDLSLPRSVVRPAASIVPVAYSHAPGEGDRVHPVLPAVPTPPGAEQPGVVQQPVGPPAVVTDWRGADLRGADLTGAKLAWARLTGAKLEGAKLLGATLTEADLWLTDLRGADLRGADLTGAKLTPPEAPGAPRPEVAREARASDPAPTAQNPREVSTILPASIEERDPRRGESAF